MPSFDEGLPNLILEAMGCGTPVLTTTVGAIPDLVIDGETGFLLKERTPIEIATSILEVMDYPDLSSITYQAKSTLDQSYSFSASIVRYQAIIDKMIA
jgi:glycosyltransferase involved in cell wall biosynthesis